MLVRFSKRTALTYLVEGHAVDPVHELELGAAAPVGRLQGPLDQATLAQKTAPDRVGRDEDVGGFGVKIGIRRAEEAEAFLRNFEVADAHIGRTTVMVA